MICRKMIKDDLCNNLMNNKTKFGDGGDMVDGKEKKKKRELCETFGLQMNV